MSLLKGLGKSRQSFFARLKGVLPFGGAKIGPDLLERIEETLIASDLGVDLSLLLVDQLEKSVALEKLKKTEDVLSALKAAMRAILKAAPRADYFAGGQKPAVFLMVGVNGSGKTTSAAKLARYFQRQGKTALFAACDTFRAAAIDQLSVWAERTSADIVKQKPGSDSASVAFDALKAAKARQNDLLIVDTAGRLHTKANLMAELKKIRQVLLKNSPDLALHTFLVLDGTGGQNSLAQAREFNASTDVTGLCITKLDGTAKGGAVFAVCHELSVPVAFIGTGEGIDDLEPFDAGAFVDSFFTEEG